jgi:hypothetical protein
MKEKEKECMKEKEKENKAHTKTAPEFAVKKCSTGQSCIRKEVTSYKIHILWWSFENKGQLGVDF